MHFSTSKSSFFSHHTMILFIVSLALFMEALDATIINTAIPAMSRSLNVNPIDLKIALISYLLSLAIFIPISGWFADKYGIKRVFIGAVTIFTVSSLWCGFSHTLFELVIARVVQGVGGAFALPVGRLILVRTFEKRKYVSVMSRVVIVGALGMMLGPVLGGLITHYFSWPWIFWVNIPVGILAIIIAKIYLAKNAPVSVPPLDKLGFVLFGTGLAALTFSLSAFSESSLHSSVALSIFVTSILLLLIYVWHSYHRPHAVVNTGLFRFRTFRVSTIANLLTRLSFGGLPFLLPILFQIVLGYSPQKSGLLIAPMAIGICIVKPFTLRILRVLGYKKVLIINTLLVAGVMWNFIWINAETTIFTIGFLTFIFGFIISMQYTAMNSIAYAEIPNEQLSAATSIMSTLQQLVQSFGVAMAALLIRYFSRGSSSTFLLTIPTFHHTFFIMGMATLLSSVIFLLLKSEDGRQIMESAL